MSRETVLKSIIIGIAGGSGSGKSTFTNRIKKAFTDEVTVIYHDNYYKCNDGVPMDERRAINYDHPEALDTQLLIEHLKSLKKGETAECPLYDYSVHNRKEETVSVKPAKVIVVEGILVLENPELRDLFDIKIYVEADADERIIRRIIRDVNQRGRYIEDIANQYLETVKPMHYIYVEPTRSMADIVINSGMNDVAFDLVKNKIENILEEGGRQG